MMLKSAAKTIVRNLGYDLARYNYRSHPTARQAHLFSTLDIDLCLDVGANSGQFARHIRKIGYAGRIVSFEPLSSAYKSLSRNAANDPLWDVKKFALGSNDEGSEINIAANSFSSSLLEMLDSHADVAPDSKYINKEEISVRRLDSIFSDIQNNEKHIYLKLDVQGFEPNVIAGAKDSLRLIDTLQLEMSLVPLYRGEILFHDIVNELYEKGYVLVSLEQGLAHPTTGHLIQVDGIFHRCKNAA